jgi:hypothetical protein
MSNGTFLISYKLLMSLLYFGHGTCTLYLARGLEKTIAGADLTFSQRRPEKSPFFFSFSNVSSQAFTPET